MKLHNATQRHFDLVKQNPKHWRTICRFLHIVNQLLLTAVDLSTKIIITVQKTMVTKSYRTKTSKLEQKVANQ